jgi:hypothetical protein
VNTTITTPTTAAVGHGRRAALAGLALAAVVTGGALATAVPATATPDRAASATALASPPAIPGVPDVGRPGEVVDPQRVPTIDPHGNRVQPGSATTRAVGTTATIVIVDGARIRTQPVNGTVIGLVQKNDWFFVNCKRRASDGYVWGYGHNNGRWGWMRDDLWDVIYFTAPGAPSPRPIPWC